MYQTMSYENQLKMKECQVRELLDGALNGTDYQWEGIHAVSYTHLDYEVTVDFDKVGIKKMFAGFAKLKKI